MGIVITVPQGTTTTNLVELATEGKVVFHRERSNGTYRRVHFLTGKAYEEALWVQTQREEGMTMKALAAYLHSSVAAVRRTLNDLAMTEALLESDAEELEDMLAGAYEAGDEASPEATEAAPVTATEATTEPATEPFVCDWDGHQSAMDEHGFCPVCQ